MHAEEKIYVVTYAPPPFSFQTGGDLLATSFLAGAAGVLAGGLGGLLVGMQADSRGQAQGQEMARAHSLEDPALRVRDAFVSSIASHFNLANLVPVQESLTNDDIKTIGEKLSQATVLDFKTDGWSLLPGPMSLSLYRVIYGVRSRLLRTADGRVLWQGYCRYDGVNSRATMDELKANSGALLKAKMNEAADFCVKTLVAQFSGQG